MIRYSHALRMLGSVVIGLIAMMVGNLSTALNAIALQVEVVSMPLLNRDDPKDKRIIAVFDRNAKSPCRGETSHTWILAPVIDLSVSAMCYKCDTPTRALTEDLISP